MSNMNLSVQVEAPCERVFAVFTDIPNGASIVPAIEKIEMLTPGPVRIGTKFRETRTMMKRSHTEEFEVVAMRPPNEFALACESCGVDVRAEYTFTERPGYTLVEMSMRATPRTLVAKILSPLMNALMGKAMRREMQKDLEQIKRYAERGGRRGK